jgi:hypothetical protein
MFDNTDAVSLELLRFRRDLAVAPGFDNALRDGVERLASVRHPALAPARAVVYLDEHDLTLVSTHVSGQRLSELVTGKLQKGLHPAIVTWIIREVTSALAALHSSGPVAAHGALHADRIVFTPEGRLLVTEHALGPALQRLGLSPRALWREFDLLALTDERGLARLDARNDVVQLGTVALSLLLARTITLADLVQRLPALLDEFSAMAAASPSAFAAPLRVWLEHALQLAPHSYRSAADAQEGLKELPPSTGGFLGTFGSESAVPHEDLNEPASIARLETARPLRPQIGDGTGVRSLAVAVQERRDTREPFVRTAPSITDPEPAPDPPRPHRSRAVWLAAALAVVVIVEAIVIARLAFRPAAAPPADAAVVIESPNAGDTVLLDGKPVGATPLRLTVTPGTRAIRLVRGAGAVAAPQPVVAAARSTESPDNERRTLTELQQAAAQQRSGGVRISSPIELKVLEGDRVLGSTADGPIVTTAGVHQLDLMNTTLGYRTHQTVTIRAGSMAALAITPPMGRISVNAEPWAQVSIDDKAIGDTPLANVSVSLGDHQVVFRHPQFGERRETVTVRADAPARISTSFQR